MELRHSRGARWPAGVGRARFGGDCVFAPGASEEVPTPSSGPAAPGPAAPGLGWVVGRTFLQLGEPGTALPAG